MNNDPLIFELFRTAPTKGEKTKLRIVEAAIRCIATVGIASTTFEAIAKEAGMAKSHVVYHFKDKRDIVEDAVRYVTGIAQRLTILQVQEATDWRSRLYAIFDSALEWSRKYPEHLPVLLQFYQLCTIDEKYLAMHSAIRAAGMERIRALVRAAPGHRWDDKKLELTSRSIQNLMIGNLIDFHTTRQWRSRKELRAATLSAIDAILAGSRAP